jgi:hypothetical protein
LKAEVIPTAQFLIQGFENDGGAGESVFKLPRCACVSIPGESAASNGIEELRERWLTEDVPFFEPSEDLYLIKIVPL